MAVAGSRSGAEPCPVEDIVLAVSPSKRLDEISPVCQKPPKDATAVRFRTGSGDRLTSRRCHEVTSAVLFSLHPETMPHLGKRDPPYRSD
jgi:hypothetical protein